jgi:GNAT superfamily N-acetyltransferase
MTTIRPVTSDDVPDVLRMARRFLSSDGPYHGRIAVNDASVCALATLLMDGGERLGLVAESGGQVVGMFGMFCFTHPITNERVAAELCWWIDPEARGSRLALQLLRTAETWARDAGAQVIEMIAPDERVAQLYDRIGYERTDVHYRKTL